MRHARGRTEADPGAHGGKGWGSQGVHSLRGLVHTERGWFSVPRSATVGVEPPSAAWEAAASAAMLVARIGRVVRVREVEYAHWVEARDVPLTGAYRPPGHAT